MDADELNDFFGNDNFGDEPSLDEEVTEENDAVLDSLFEEENKDGKSKSRRKQPIPAASRLNEALLMGPKGIKYLEELCLRFQPDPKRGPYKNLDELMHKFEHWGHVMFPKFTFEDVVAQCEKLGDRRAVKVYMDKLRLGMPITDEDYNAMINKEKRVVLIGADDDDEETRKSLYSDEDEPFSTGRPSLLAARSMDIHLQPSPINQFSQDLRAETVSTERATLSEEDRRRIADNRLRALQIREQKRLEQEQAARRDEEEQIKEMETAEEVDREEAVLEEEGMMDEEALLAEMGF